MEQAGGEGGTPVPSEAFDVADGEDQGADGKGASTVSNGSEDKDEA